MTKLRDPVTIEDTLMIVIGELHMEQAVAVTGRKKGYLSNLTDPAKRQALTVQDLELLDLAHHAQFARGFLLYEALGRRLETAGAERFADALAVGHHAVDLARENGEACAALMEAAIAAGDPRLLEEALRQIEDVHKVATATIGTIRSQLARARDAPPDTS